MKFQFSKRHVTEYRTLGYTIFRGIVPPALVEDLRRACDAGRELARARQGPQTQRFQPVTAFEIDQRPFEEYRALPELRDAVMRLLTPAHQAATNESLGVLLEPAELPYCTEWHRDWRDNVPGIDLGAWETVSQDPDLFNQVNCALYEDGCTWVVPGSHRRPDTPEEATLLSNRSAGGPKLEGSAATRERACLDYCLSMPDAQRLLLDAGDYALYRNTLWHLGNYIPYCKRATLHDAVETPRFAEWRRGIMEDLARRQAAEKSSGAATSP